MGVHFTLMSTNLFNHRWRESEARACLITDMHQLASTFHINQKVKVKIKKVDTNLSYQSKVKVGIQKSKSFNLPIS